MSANIIRSQYDVLEQIAARFAAQAEAVQEQQQRIEQHVAVLEGGGWQARGIDAFSREMRGEVFPAVERLHLALAEAQQVTLAISATIRTAEEEAATLFRSAYSAERKAQVGREIEKRIDELQEADEAPDNTTVYDSDRVISELLAPHKRSIIENIAERYGIEPALLAGVVASEMDFDYDHKDAVQDFFGRIGISGGTGPGVANVHTDLNLTWASEYLTEHSMNGADWAPQYDRSIKNRVSFEGSVEAAAIITAVLANEHGGVHSAEDMAVVWAGYRTGIQDLIPGDENWGFESITDYQNHIARDSDMLDPNMKMGANAYMSQPYFDYFIQAFAEKPPSRPTPIPVPTPSPH